MTPNACLKKGAPLFLPFLAPLALKKDVVRPKLPACKNQQSARQHLKGSDPFSFDNDKSRNKSSHPARSETQNSIYARLERDQWRRQWRARPVAPNYRATLLNFY
jgi:hypothetical protein